MLSLRRYQDTGKDHQSKQHRWTQDDLSGTKPEDGTNRQENTVSMDNDDIEKKQKLEEQKGRREGKYRKEENRKKCEQREKTTKEKTRRRVYKNRRCEHEGGKYKEGTIGRSRRTAAAGLLHPGPVRRAAVIPGPLHARRHELFRTGIHSSSARRTRLRSTTAASLSTTSTRPLARPGSDATAAAGDATVCRMRHATARGDTVRRMRTGSGHGTAPAGWTGERSPGRETTTTTTDVAAASGEVVHRLHLADLVPRASRSAGVADVRQGREVTRPGLVRDRWEGRDGRAGRD